MRLKLFAKSVKSLHRVKEDETQYDNSVSFTCASAMKTYQLKEKAWQKSKNMQLVFLKNFSDVFPVHFITKSRQPYAITVVSKSDGIHSGVSATFC